MEDTLTDIEQPEGDQQEQQDPQPPKKLGVSDFAAKIKAKYPDYKNVPDDELVNKIIIKYPAYADQVDLTAKKKDISASSVGQSNVPSDSKIPLVYLPSKHKFLSGVFDVADENTPEPTQPAKQTSFFQGLANTIQKGKQAMDKAADPVLKTKNAQDFIKKDLSERGINVDVNKEMDNPNLAAELGVYYNDRNKDIDGQISKLRGMAQFIFEAKGADVMDSPDFVKLNEKIIELKDKKQQLSEHVGFLLGQQLSKNPDATPKEIGKVIREVIQPENKTVREQMFGDKLLTKEQIESRDFNDEFNGISAKQDAVINDFRNGHLDEVTARKKMDDLSTQFNTIEKKYPTVAIDALRNIIGDRIAAYRKDNDNPLETAWHNIVMSEAGPFEIKGVIEELKKNGVDITPEQEKQIFESKEKIPLTSAAGNFYHNFILNPANKLSNLLQSPFSPSTDNSEREKEFRNVNSLAPVQSGEQAQIVDIGNGKKTVRMGNNPEAGNRSDIISWGTLNNAAQTAGTIGAYLTANKVLGGGVGLLGAGKTATNILGNISASAFLNYDDYKKAAQEQGAGDGMQNVYAFGRSIVDGLLFSEFSMNKIKSVEPAIEKKITDEFMTKFSDGSFDKSKLADWIVSTSKDLGKNISIVKAQQLSGIVADKLLSPQKNEDRNATDELMSNIPADIISVLPFSAMSGYHTTAEKSGKIRQAVSMATADPAKFEDRMNELVSEGKIKESDAKEKIDYINNLAQKAKHPDLNTPKTQNLSPDQRQDYAHSLVTEETLKKQGEGLTDQVQKADVTDSIKQEQEFRKSTLLKSEIGDKAYKELSDAEKAKFETPKDYGNVKTQPSGTEDKFTPIIIDQNGDHQVLNKSFDSPEAAKIYGENKLKQKYFDEHISTKEKEHPAEVKPAEKPITTQNAEIDLSGKASSELYDLAKQAKEKMRSDEDDILGDKAKEYRQAKMNGDTAKIDKIENSLTPEQADKFFGKGQAALEPQEIANLGQKISIIEQAENVNDLAQSSKQALIDLSNGRNKMQSKAVLGAVKKKATELGIDTNELTREALKVAGNNFSDKADAVDVLSNLFNPKEEKSVSIPSSGGLEGDKKGGNVGSTYPVPDKPISEMTSDEIRAHTKILKQHFKDQEVEFFGEEGAKRYRELQDISNSNYASREKQKAADAEITKIEEGLTDKQKKQFFGEAQPGDTYEYDVAELRDISRTVSNIEQSEDVNELSKALKMPLLDFSKSPTDEGNLAAINAAKRRAVELGIDPKELIENAVKNIVKDLPDDNDKEFLAKKLIEKLLKPNEPKSSLPLTPDKGVEEPVNETKNEENKATEIPNPSKETGDTAPPTGETPPKAESPEEGSKVGVHHSALTDIAKDLGLPEPERAEYVSPKEYADRGSALMEAGAKLDEIDNKSNELHDRISIGRAYWEKGVTELNGLRKSKGKNSEEYKAKEKEVNELLDKIKKLGSKAGQAMTSLQGERDMGTDNFEMVKREVEDLTGKPINKEQEKRIDELTSKNENLQKRAEKAEQDLVEATDKFFEEKQKSETKNKRAARIKKVDSLFDEAIKSFDKGATYSAIIPPPIIKAALKGMKEAYHAGEAIGKLIDDAIKYISEKLGNDEWDKSTFRKEWVDKFLEAANEKSEGKLSLEDLQKMFIGKPGNKFSFDESKQVWQYMKDNYLNKGKKISDAIGKTANDLGLSWRQTSNAITSKKIAPISDAMWKRRRELTRNQNATKRYVDDQDKSAVRKFVRGFFGVLRADRVFGHGGIFVGTHAGMNLFNPTQWHSIGKAFLDGYKFSYGNIANYERAMEALKNDPNYIIAQRGGLKNNPDQHNVEEFQKSQKWLGKLGNAGERGFNAIKVLRQNMFNAEYNRRSDIEKEDPNTAKQISEIINLSTGATNLKIPEVVNEITFAGGMESARFGKLLKSPAKATEVALKTLFQPDKASLEEKVFAKVWARRVGAQLSTFAGALIVNTIIQHTLFKKKDESLLDAIKNKFNPNNPNAMKFEFGDLTVDPTSGMRSTAQFVYGLGKTPFQTKKERGGDNVLQSWGKKVFGYARGKVSPGASLLVDMASKTDYYGNTMPFSDEKPAAGKHKLTWGEYAGEVGLPLPLAEATHEMIQSYYDNGGNSITGKQILNGILLAGLSGGTGFRVGEPIEGKPTPFNDDDKKDPTFKYFLDKGMELPNISLNSEVITDEKNKTKKTVSEYPKEVQDQYTDSHKEFLKSELSAIIDQGVVYVKEYTESDGSKKYSVSVDENKDYDEEYIEKKLDNLSKPELAEVLSEAQRKATVQTKKKIFDQ